MGALQATIALAFDTRRRLSTRLAGEAMSNTMHVLLVEDDVTLADGISRLLISHGMHVSAVSRGLDVAIALQRARVTVMILDIGLPDINGFEVLRMLRTSGNMVPVILLTARDAVHDRVQGLELGADDYLVKPFATSELIARIKAIVRRVAPRQAELRIGGLALDNDTKRARVNGQIIEFSAREWAVLEYLMQNAGRVVSKQQIIDAVVPWGEDITMNAVEVYVSRIRIKIIDSGVAIRAIRGFGYLLEQAES